MSRSQRPARRGAGPVFEVASLGPGTWTPRCPAVEEARSPPEFPSCYPSFRMFAEARTPFLSPRSTLQFPGEILNDSAKAPVPGCDAAGVGEALALSTVSELQSPGHRAENPTAWHTCPGRRGCPRRAIGSSFPRPSTAASARGQGQVQQRAGSSTSCPGRRHHPLVTRVASFSPAPPADKPADDGPVFPRISPEPTPALGLGRGLCCAPGVSSPSPRGACLCRPVPRSAFVSADTGERTDAAHGRDAP